MKQYEYSLDVFQSINDKKGIASMLSNMGGIYYNQGNDDKSLELYLQSLSVTEESKDTSRRVTVLGNIGAIYGKKPQTYDLAIKYYRQAYPLSITLHDPLLIGTNAVNLGEVFMNKGVYDSALFYFNISLNLLKGTVDALYTMNDMGALFLLKKEYDMAINMQKQTYRLAEKVDAKYEMGLSLLGLAKTYHAKGDLNDALIYYNLAERMADSTKDNYSLLEIYKGLSEIYTNTKDYTNASLYQKLLLNIKDTIYNIESDKKLGTLQFTYDLEKKGNEINLLTKDQKLRAEELATERILRNAFVGGFIIVLLFAGVFFRQRNKISKERNRSEELLLNILPEETAQELKQTGKAKARRYESVTVLFTDFKGFSNISETLKPEELVEVIDHYFRAFDKIIRLHGIEKIKTIGDSYMCVSGLPTVNTDHAYKAVRAALDIKDFVSNDARERRANGLIYFEIRIGLHSGPVVAGIVGESKFAYDVWGDTVNMASRMESSGVPNRVNVSGETYELIKDQFECFHRGKLNVKHKDNVEMYFVEREIIKA